MLLDITKWWPFVWKPTHHLQLEILQACNSNLNTTIQMLEHVIVDKDREIASLVSQLTRKNVIITRESTAKVAKIAKSEPVGRGGWRTRSQAMSDATAPKPQDSIKALEQRVKDAGGNTDAV